MRIIESKLNTYSLPSTFVAGGDFILDLRYRSSNIDSSASPKTIVATGTEAYVEGRYGEPSFARNMTSTQADSTLETVGSLDKYSISQYLKINADGQFITRANNSNNIGLNLLSGAAYGGLNVLVVYNNVSNYGHTYEAFSDGYKVGDSIHVVSVIDSINKTAQLYFNGKDVTNKTIGGLLTKDTSQIVPFPDETVTSSHVGLLGDVDIYFTKIRDYLMTPEEVLSEFLSKDTSFNIVINMGGYGTTKFIDSDDDGLADDLSIYSGGLYSIIEDEGGRGQKLYSEIGGNLGYYVGDGGSGTVPQLEIGGTYQFYIKYKNNTVNSKFHRYLGYLPNSNDVVSEFTGVYTLTTATQIVPIINFPSSVAGDYLTIYTYTIIKL